MHSEVADRKGVAQRMSGTLRAPSQKTQKRLIIAMALILVVGIPAIGVLYFFDQYRDPGPSLVDRTLQEAEAAVRANPNALGARFALAEIYAGKGRYADAIVQYDEILRVQPDSAGVLLSRGKALMALGKLDEATADFQKVVDGAKGGEMANADPQLEAAYYNLGAVALKRGQPTQAITLLTNAVSINRTDADALYLLGTAFIQSGDPKTGIDALHRAIALVPTGWCDPYSQLAQAYVALADAAGAQYANGMVAFCEKRYPEAQKQLDAASSGAYALDAFVGLGLLAEEQGDNVAAAAAYEKALAKDPQNFAAITGLGRVNAAMAPSVSPAASPSGGS